MKLSKEKIDKISEQILLFLYEKNPEPVFTAHIAKELARDEEFIKKIMFVLKEKKLVLNIKKNKEGIDYIIRNRWKLNPKVYEFYKKANNK